MQSVYKKLYPFLFIFHSVCIVQYCWHRIDHWRLPFLQVDGELRQNSPNSLQSKYAIARRECFLFPAFNQWFQSMKLFATWLTSWPPDTQQDNSWWSEAPIDSSWGLLTPKQNQWPNALMASLSIKYKAIIAHLSIFHEVSASSNDDRGFLLLV